jgi:2-hydroxy-4-carboxymuconate semialdehyde hemiacetal dehydrogenase
MKIALVGAGAFGEKHLAALRNLDGVEVAMVVSASYEEAARLAARFGIDGVGDSYEATVARNDIDAVILCTPTPMHARQAIQAMNAGKHVEVEIPLADNWAEAQAVLAKQRETGLVCMVGHTRRFNPCFSAAGISTRRASPGPGAIICFGITPRIPSIFSST